MTLFPYGVAIAFGSFMVALVVWQRLIFYSSMVFGLHRQTAQNPAKIRSKALQFIITLGALWFCAFTAAALAFGLSPTHSSAWIYVFTGGAMVPIAVAPGVVRVFRKTKSGESDSSV